MSDLLHNILTSNNTSGLSGLGQNCASAHLAAAADAYLSKNGKFL